MLTKKKVIHLIKMQDSSLEENVRRSNSFSEKKLSTNPIGFKVKAQGKGEIKLKCDLFFGGFYKFDYRLLPSRENDEYSKWTSIVTSRPEILISGLESGKEYAFRVLHIDLFNNEEYSEEIRSHILPI